MQVPRSDPPGAHRLPSRDGVVSPGALGFGICWVCPGRRVGQGTPWVTARDLPFWGAVWKEWREMIGWCWKKVLIRCWWLYWLITNLFLRFYWPRNAAFLIVCIISSVLSRPQQRDLFEQTLFFDVLRNPLAALWAHRPRSPWWKSFTRCIDRWPKVPNNPLNSYRMAIPRTVIIWWYNMHRRCNGCQQPAVD